MQTMPRRDEHTLLASNFHPGEHDVICSRGLRAYNHVGNRSFRQIIDENLVWYTQAKSRAEKSMTIMSIVDQIRRQSPGGGGFIRFCQRNKCYFEIGDCRAREKVGHAFRIAMSSDGGRRLQDTRSSRIVPIEMKPSSIVKECNEVIRSKTLLSTENTEQLFCNDKPLPCTAPNVVVNGVRIGI